MGFTHSLTPSFSPRLHHSVALNPPPTHPFLLITLRMTDHTRGEGADEKMHERKLFFSHVGISIFQDC